MKENKALNYIKEISNNIPSDWLKLTTHRLDIYNESLAKTEFLEEFEKLYQENNFSASSLEQLPTAFDYIRLGHPLSCVLEWEIAQMLELKADSVISFSSKTTPILAILRKNLFEGKNTQIAFTGELPSYFDVATIQTVYGYNFELLQVDNAASVPAFDGSTVFIAPEEDFLEIELQSSIDFYLTTHTQLGSIIVVNGSENEKYISEIQHVRRRKTIAMTPANCFKALQLLTGKQIEDDRGNLEADRTSVRASIKQITNSNSKALIGSSGLSIQYAIVMGLIDDALENQSGKGIRIVVPPNCYGGTNDQARRVAACLPNVEVVDLPVDGGNDMVQSIDQVLDQIAKEDAIPLIIAEIPTNPRVEVPDLQKLKDVLSKERQTESGTAAVDPVFILDQTFCPNVRFLGDKDSLSSVRTISYVSGSKFPSGGLCTAGYCVANAKADGLMAKIEKHLILCDNEATALQLELLAKQMPSMLQRIEDAYVNTRDFVNFIQKNLPEAKINFVSEELARLGFTPSVFSLDLPTKGDSETEKESYKRALNNKLINMMIGEIPNESKYCVSYGQLKGCYWTIPATSTQGTTKEGDKDYIVRVALSGNMDLEKHKEVFMEFVASI
ncbi:MAG: cystathionine beta-synthase [Crocinitomicaceae bacterium]